MSKSIIFDTETTGLNVEDRIIQVGAIIVDSSPNIEDIVIDELCSSEIQIKIPAMAVHGIRQNKVDNKPSFSETKFYKMLSENNTPENYLVAHNLDFDKEMLEKENFINSYSLIDTLQCAKHLYELGEDINGYKLPNYQLQTFRYILFNEEYETKEANKYNVEIKAHDAIGDVIILKLFFRVLAEKVKAKYKLKGYSNIMNKLVELTSEFVIIEKITFGKFKGQLINDIVQKADGKSWINWYLNSADNIDKNLKYSLNLAISNT